MKHKVMRQSSLARKTVQPTHAQKNDETATLWARHLGKSLMISIGIGAFLLMIAALIAYFSPDPNRLILPLGLVTAGLTAFFGGLVTVRIHGHSALMCGLLNGSLMTVLMLLVSLFFTSVGMGYAAWLSCLLHSAFLLLSVAGAYLGLKRNRTPRKKRKK